MKQPNPDNVLTWVIYICVCLLIATCTAKEVYKDYREMTNDQR